jgi:cytochrome c peroxidase
MVLKNKGRIIQSGIIACCVIASFFYSCKKDDPITTPDPGDPSLVGIEFKIPGNWPTPVYNFSQNPLTKEGFKLGRKLFFETKLSRDNTVSCGSCHQPFAAFSQIEHNVSHGVDEKIGTRNSPALFNLNWHTSFFWDGGVNHIELQPFGPITNPLEMDETLVNIVAKLQADAGYRQLFKEAFGSEEVTTQKIAKSLAQFMGLMVSSNSKYDKYIRNESGGSFTTQEENGLTIFRNKCASCHTEPLFSNFTFRNNGLALIANTKGVIDSGRGIITPNDPSSYYTFKVPSVRNLKYTTPYMHDGRFTTVDQVLEHYSTGIHQTPNLDPSLTAGISLTASEKEDLKAFLNTLNDETFVKDIRFREPK